MPSGHDTYSILLYIYSILSTESEAKKGRMIVCNLLFEHKC